MAAAETASAPALTATPARSLVPSRFQQAEHARTVWRVVAEEGTAIEDVLKPMFWAHVAHTMARFDKIEILADDETWFVELIVRDCGRGFAKVALFAKIEFDAADGEKSTTLEGFTIAWKGPKRRFVVVRDADSTLVKEELASKALALAWVQDFVRAGGN